MNSRLRGLEDLQSWVLKVEKQNRRFRQLGAAVLIVVTLLLVMGQARSVGSVTNFFNDSFQSGNTNNWDSTQNLPQTNAFIPPVVASPDQDADGFSASIHYQANNSNGHETDAELSRLLNQTHFHVRAYVRFQNNGGNLSSGADIQRKLIWLRHDESGPASWSLILTTHSNGGSRLQLVLIDAGCSDQFFYQYYNTALTFDTWYSIEMEIQVNAPGQKNGFWNLWVNGIPANFAGQDGTGTQKIQFEKPCKTTTNNTLTSIWIGQQLEGGPIPTLDEFRYWDNIVFSNNYIGP